MAISDNLMLALLSMDVYNRGENPRLAVSGSTLGNATKIDFPIPATALNAGFFAQAYTLNGKTIIAYRGTDDFLDASNGWLTGGGAYSSAQAEAAAKFFQTVNGSLMPNSNITLTGHSLGGGLAGFISKLYGSSAVMFDNMPFELAADRLNAAAQVTPHYDANGAFLGNYADDPAAQALFYGGSDPWSLYSGRQNGVYLQGEGLAVFRNLQSAPTVAVTGSSTLSFLQLHDMPLLAILMFADPTQNPGSGVASAWTSVRDRLLPALFRSEIAQALGISGSTGAADQQLRMMLAYSAIDEGTKLYGSTGIRSLFDDASDLGGALSASNASQTISKVANSLTAILVQYAGHLARSQDETATNKNGVITKSDAFLTVDLGATRWGVGQEPTKIVGRDDLLKEILSDSGAGTDFTQAFQKLWNDPTGSRIDRIVLTTKNEVFSGNMPVRPENSATNGITLFSSSDQGDTITGTDRDEAIYAGGGADHVNGGKGSDFLVGGAGDDELDGGDGNDFLVGGDGVDILKGGDGNDEVWGGAQADKISGGAGDDLIRAGNQNDVIFADAGNDAIYGEDGADTYRYLGDAAVTGAPNSWDAAGVILTLTGETVTTPTGPAVNAVLSSAQTGSDKLIGVEIVELTDARDTVRIEPNYTGITGKIVFDGLGQPDGVGDVIDLSALSGEVAIKTEGHNVILGDLTFTNFEEIILTAGNDSIAVGSAIEKVYAGAGNDIVKATADGVAIDLGDGDDKLVGNGKGAIVYTGDGNDRIEISHNGQMLVADASTLDRMTMYGVTLTGGIHWHASESPYAYGKLGERYGRNQEGNLVIVDWSGNETFIPNFNFAVGGTDLTAGIYVIDLQIYYRNIMHLPSGFDILDSWEALMGHAMKAMTGHSMWGTAIDPLMFDLNGDGISLSPREANNASFDIDGDGFAEELGWARGGDGFLVRDINENGKIDDIKEMFGNQFQSGFEQLALLDGNHDGKIDENDNGLADFNGDGVIDAEDTFDTLRIWIDGNEDGKTDSGELVSLDSLGIASISVASTLSNTDSVGNTIVATGTYTKTDGTTGTVAHVDFKVNDFNSVWLGDHTVSTEAAALPDIKGHGTLTDLRVAMTIADSLVDVVDNNLQFLNSTNLETLRLAARPILAGWASAVPVPASTPGFTPRADFNIVVEETAEGPVVRDFLIQKTDSQGSYWALASGHAIKDASDAVIARPTREQVLNSIPEAGEWTILAGSDITFLERFLGDEIALDVTNNPGAEAIAAASTVLNFATHELNEIVVRLAAQGPLKPFFAGIEYDIAADIFKPTTDHQLIPMLEAIFEATPADPAGALDFIGGWKTIISVMMPDFERGGSGQLTTYAYLFQNLVGAYENVPIALTLQQAAGVLDIPEDAIRVGSGTVLGTTDADLFYLDSSNQLAKGAGGYDSYIVGRDFGHDVIQDIMEGYGESQEDSIRFAHLNRDQLAFRREGTDLVITEIGTQNEIRVVDEFAGRRPGLITAYMDFDKSIEIITFADGTVWDKMDIARAVGMPSFATDDTVIGTGDVDFLNGGAGDDVMIGGDLGDHYMFGRGDGHDVIQDNQNWIWMETPDFLHFGGDITLADLWFGRVDGSSDLLVGIVGTDDLLTIAGQFDVGYGLLNTTINRVEIFTFEDGDYIDWEYIIQRLNAEAGTDGDDVIYGFSYEDILDGGKGDDFLMGGNENDTYIFGRGYGHDTIRDHLTMILSGNDDTVQFNEGVNRGDVTLTRIGDSGDLTITINETGDVLDVLGQFNVIYGLIATRDDRIEYFKFGDGTILNWEEIILEFNAAAGTDDDDVIYGFSYADTLAGGKGNDFLNGGVEDDTYVYTRGDGNDIIQEDANAQAPAFDTLRLHDVAVSDVSIVRSGNDLTLVIAETAVGAGDGGTILLKEELDDWFARGLEQIVFDDGTVWTQNTLRLRLLAEASTSGDDAIVGFNVNDVIRAGHGDDTINAGAGDDTYIYARGDGHDVITDGPAGNFSTIDTLTLEGINPTDVSIVRNGIDLTILIAESSVGAGDGGSILLKDELENWFARGIETISFADGTVWTQADLRVMLLEAATTSGNDYIEGFNVNDIIRGGLGDDTLMGGAGDDTYHYARGDGNDTIIEVWAGNFSTIDTLVLEGINPSEVTATRNGNDITLTIAESTPGAGDGSAILLKDSFEDWFSRGVERIVFADGTVWTQSSIRTALISASGTPGNDVITGSISDDIIAGGLGDDTISGGAGDDTYIYTRGDGNDIIDEGAAGNNTTIDTLRLQGVAVASVSLVRNGTELTLVIAESSPGSGDGGSVLLKNELDDWFSSGVENIVFDDGTVWTQGDLRIRLLQLAWTPGNDVVNGFNTNDTIRGGAGDDQLSGGAGDDTYVWARGDGNDTIIEGWGGNFSTVDKLVLEGVNATDVTFVRAGNDIRLYIEESTPGASDGGTILLKESLEDFFSQGVETIQFADGMTWTQADLRAKWLESVATSGNDVISGFQGSDILRGGAGDDVLSGGNSSDTYLYTRGDGNDVVNDNASSGANALVLHAIAPTEITTLRNGVDALLLIGADGVDGRIRLSGQLSSSGNITSVTFDDGTVWTDQTIAANAILNDGSVVTHLGGTGNDDVTGTSDIDVFDGGAGNDTLRGQAGDDVYLFGVGSGNDVIVEGNAVDGGSGDLIKLKGLNAADVALERQGNNLVLTIISSGETLTVSNQFDGTTGIEQLAFSDGSVWSRAQIQSAAWIRGTSGNDTLSGTDGDDVIDGGSGNDSLAGRAGSDTYIYRVGSGNDTISESMWDAGTDIIKLDGLNVSDVQFAQSGTDLLLRILSSNETLTVSSQFNGNNGIEQVVFADGTAWDRTAIQSASWILGTTGNDTITGQGAAETFDGLAGDDTLNGRDGGDTYIFRVGSGNDTISESQWDAGTDTLKLDGLSIADVEFSKSGTDLIIRLLSSNETVLVSSQFNGNNGIEQVVFADGTIWDRAAIQAASWILGTPGNDTITGQDAAEVFDGRAGDDTLNGRGGGDTYIFRGGSGNDTISESQWDAGIDTLKLDGLNVADVEFSMIGTDLIVRVLSSNETVLVSSQFNGNNGIEQIVFADGTIWDRAAIQAASWILGTPGNDTITGQGGAESFDGRAGDDVLNGRDGGDTYIFRVGSGNDTISESLWDGGTDTLKLDGLNIADVEFSMSGSDLVVRILSSNETVKVLGQSNGSGIEQVAFADGTTWDRSAITAASWFRGTAGNDSITATSANDILVGGLGNDYLKGSAGSDIYLFASGHGNDEINDDSGSTTDTDVVRFTDLNAGDVTLGRSNNDLLIGINGTSEVIKVDNQFSSQTENWGIEKIEFANGAFWDLATINANAWYRGTSGNDWISGSSGNDTFKGGLGDDHFASGAGSDRYIYASGDGNDYIDDESGSTSDVDVVQFVDLNAGDLTFSRIGGNLVATVNANGQTVTFDEQFYSQTANWGIEKIEFANGSSWDLAAINANAWIRGTAGNDTIAGSSWNDTFKGGLGDDRFSSGAGSDRYVYASGDGNDYIDDESGSTSDIDVLQLTDLNAGDLTFSRVGVHLVATVNANGQTITFDEQFYSQTANWGIEKIEFANGSSWDLATINANAWIRGTTGNDTISGTAWNDTISGGAGNDALSGGAGDDLFVFRTSFGQDSISDFSLGHDKLEFGDGLFADAAAAFAAASTQGSNTVITIDASTTILLQNVALANLHVDDFRVV